MRYKIDVLMPHFSQYNALHYFTRKFCEAFQRAGHECRLLDGDERYFKPVESPPDFTLCFNGAIKTPSGLFLNDLIQVPNVACLVDPPYRFQEILTSPYMIMACDDRYHIEAFAKGKNKNFVFLPNAVERELAPDPKDVRIYDVTMLATFIDFEERRNKWKEILPKDVYTAMNEAIEMTWGDEETSFVKAFEITFNNAVKRSRDAGIFAVNFVEVLKELEMYVKGCERVRLVQSVTDATLHVFAGGDKAYFWEKYFKKQPNLIIHDPVAFEEGMQVTKKSRIVLNSCIKNKNGTHERVLAGLACGALSASNENIFMREYFKDGENILFYKHRELDKLNDRINYYLKHEEERREVAERGREIVMACHTWDNRVVSLLADIAPMLEAMKQITY